MAARSASGIAPRSPVMSAAASAPLRPGKAARMRRASSVRSPDQDRDQASSGVPETDRAAALEGWSYVIARVTAEGVEDVRSWSVARQRELAERLLATGRGVALVSGPAEATIGEWMREHLGTRPGLRHWIGQRTLRETAAFFTACAMACTAAD